LFSLAQRVSALSTRAASAALLNAGAVTPSFVLRACFFCTVVDFLGEFGYLGDGLRPLGGSWQEQDPFGD
jgi:hypothetical protein